MNLVDCRARIDAIKHKSGADPDEEEAAAPSRKKLSDVRPDPKVAASLGLKVTDFAPKPAAKPKAAVSGGEPDLMGGLESPPKVSFTSASCFVCCDITDMHSVAGSRRPLSNG